MNRQETIGLMALLKVNFPAHASRLDKQTADQMVNLWQYQFRDDSAQTVTAAVMSLIATKHGDWFPQVADVKEAMHRVTQPQEMTEQEAWALVRKAASNSFYGQAAKEFDKLPPILQRLVGTPNQLRDWGMMDSDTFNTVVASNFQRSYRARVKSDKEYQALPADVKELIGGVSDKMMLAE
jgi:hypothetical protein